MTKNDTKWINAGYADARGDTLGEHAPYAMESTDSQMYMCKEQAEKKVLLYWDGWNSGVMDNCRDILNKKRKKGCKKNDDRSNL